MPAQDRDAAFFRPRAGLRHVANRQRWIQCVESRRRFCAVVRHRVWTFVAAQARPPAPPARGRCGESIAAQAENSQDIVEPTGRNCAAFKIALAQRNYRNRVRHRHLARRRLPGCHAAGAPRPTRLAVFIPLGLERARQGTESARRIRPCADLGRDRYCRARRRFGAAASPHCRDGDRRWCVGLCDSHRRYDRFDRRLSDNLQTTCRNLSINLRRQRQALYHDSGCIACHGPSGYGDGPSRKTCIRNPSISQRRMPTRTPPAIFSGG